jgi:hypothetical protein
MKSLEANIIQFPVHKSVFTEEIMETPAEVISLSEYRERKRREKLMNDRSPQAAAIREHYAFIEKRPLV